MSLPVRTHATISAQAENSFLLPCEAHPAFQGKFDPDFGLGPVGGKLLPSREIIPLANQRLAKYGFDPISKADLQKPVNQIASEVGDDEIKASDNKADVALNLVFSELLGMRTSEPDTCINNRYGNFCEELICLPDGYDQTYHSVKNSSSHKDMSFIDVPKLRLAIDIRPMRLDHSSTNDGKASMVASRLKWLTNDNPYKIVYELFSLFQDINLGLTADKKFAYLPTELGGYGKPIPFKCSWNFESFCRAYKHGHHSPVVRTIVRKANRFMEKTSMGKRPEPDLLLSHVSRFSTSFHNWVKGHSIYAPTAWIDIPPELEEFRVGELGKSPITDDVFSRGLAEGMLVSESKLQVVVEHNHLCKALLGAETIPEFRELREAAVRQWKNLSVFGQETYGLIKEISPDPTDFRPLKEVEILFFLVQVDERKGLLKALFRHEPVYRREAIDRVYRKGPMFVPFQLTPRNKIGGMQFVNQTRFREDTVDTEDRQGESELMAWIESGMEGEPPRRIINDDSVIIQHACNMVGAGLVIVTDDIKLCLAANRKSGIPIFRVPCEWYYRAVYFGDSEVTPWMRFLRNRTHIDWEQIEDQGSLVSAEEKFFHDGMMLKEERRQPFNMNKGMKERDKPHLVESDFSDQPPGHPDQFLYDKFGRVSLRYRRTFAREGQGSSYSRSYVS
jgi:hypothetical protein